MCTDVSRFARACALHGCVLRCVGVCIGMCGCAWECAGKQRCGDRHGYMWMNQMLNNNLSLYVAD